MQVWHGAGDLRIEVLDGAGPAEDISPAAPSFRALSVTWPRAVWVFRGAGRPRLARNTTIWSFNADPKELRTVAAHHPSRESFCTLANRVFAALAMTAWLTGLLLCGAWTRPLGETARVWVLFLPVFLVLDLLRCKTRPEQGAYLAWLGPALAAARRGEKPAPMPGRTRRLALSYGPLALLVTYLATFLVVPAVRRPAETLDGMPAAEWAYRVIGAWYPADAREPARILALGHARDASDLRHFVALAVVLSLSVAFVAAGPGRPETAERWLLPRVAPGGIGGFGLGRWLARKPSKFQLPFVAISQVLLGGIILGVFAVFSLESGRSPVYWRLESFVPSVMFILGGCMFAWGISALCILKDVIHRDK